MKWAVWGIIVLAVAGAVWYGGARNSAGPESPSDIHANQPALMKISSTAFVHNGEIPQRYTCDGANISPPLAIEDAPESTKSFALIVDDPDAPGGTFLHWTAWNIPSGTKAVAEGTVPERAAEGNTDFGTVGYGGPCPPSGTHRYFFRLYALDTQIDLPKGASREKLESAMEGHVIDQTELIGLYERQ